VALTDAEILVLARELFPDVSASDAFLTAWLPWARSLVGSSAWALLYDQGVAMLLAARAQAAGQTTGGGVVLGAVRNVSTLGMSMSVDALVVGGSVLDMWLAGTPAGAAFLATRNTLPAYTTPYVVMF